MIPAHTFLRLPADRVTLAAEEEFFTSLRMRNGTHKTTCRGRFAAIDREPRQLVQTGRLHAYPDITVRTDDVTVCNPAFAGWFDFTRAANVLDNGYFNVPQRRAIAQSLRCDLVRGVRESCR